MNTQRTSRSLVAMVLSLALSSAFFTHLAVADDKESSSKSKAKEKKESKAHKDRAYAADPPTVKFGEFKSAEIKATSLSPKHAKSKGNQESARKIDEMLLSGLKAHWPNITVIPAGGEFSKNAERTLQITPMIEDIRLVGVGTRIMIGVMAGGSDIVMHVDFRDSSTGQIIGHPDFWKGNNAWSGGVSWGATDNQIRDAVVGQILQYTSANK
ncbi:MAG: hypothetical protein JNK85_15755 [Verrucomicrobiales bacterium]|nr:hypothetical protein [Verrucomicrobiales bacterium]